MKGRYLGACASRRCEVCGPRWAMDNRVRLLANIAIYGGPVAMLTVTAPGREAISCRHDIERWNAMAPRSWRAAHRAARQTTIRMVGSAPEVLVWEWEFQRRGALHKHVILGMRTAVARRAAHVYAIALEEELQRRGWGWADGGGRRWRTDGLREVEGIGAARYLAKYLSPVAGREGKLALTETVLRREVPPLIVYVARSLTDQSGFTMRSLRRRRLCWVLGVDWRTGEILREVPVTQAAARPQLARGP